MEHLHHEYLDRPPGELRHAVYTPATIVSASLSASGGTSVLTGVNATVYVMRTILADTSGSGKTFTFSKGADAAGTRLFDAYALTQSVPAVFNVWVTVTGSGAAHDLDANCSSTTVHLEIGGYTYA